MWTKEQIVLEAFNEIGLGSTFNVGPEEREGALRRLDSMMATWEGKGIRIGYLMPVDAAESELDSPSGLPDGAHETVFLNLAIRLAPGYGKTLTPDTRASAKSGYDALLAKAAFPLEMQPQNNLPRGAGHKRRTLSPFMPTPADPLLAAQAEPITVD